MPSERCLRAGPEVFEPLRNTCCQTLIFSYSQAVEVTTIIENATAGMESIGESKRGRPEYKAMLEHHHPEQLDFK